MRGRYTPINYQSLADSLEPLIDHNNLLNYVAHEHVIAGAVYHSSASPDVPAIECQTDGDVEINNGDLYTLDIFLRNSNLYLTSSAASSYLTAGNPDGLELVEPAGTSTRFIFNTTATNGSILYSGSTNLFTFSGDLTASNLTTLGNLLFSGNGNIGDGNLNNPTDGYFDGDLDVEGNAALGSFSGSKTLSLRSASGGSSRIELEENFATVGFYLTYDGSIDTFSITSASGGAEVTALTIARNTSTITIGSDASKSVVLDKGTASDIRSYIYGDNWIMQNNRTSGGYARSILIFEDTASSSYFQFGARGSGQVVNYGYIGTAYNDASIIFSTTNTVDGVNRVGIGMSGENRPQYTLDVNGTLNVTGVTTLSGNVDLSAADIITDTTTGTKIGTGTTQKIGFYNATPVVQASAYTQTYSTADKTHAARTAPAAGAGSGADATTFSGAECDALVADQQDTAQILNSLIDDLQALGLIA